MSYDEYDAYQHEADERNKSALRQWLSDIQGISATRNEDFKCVIAAVTAHIQRNDLLDADYGLHDVNEYLLYRLNRFRGQYCYSTEIRCMKELLKTIPPVVTWYEVKDQHVRK